MNYKERIKAEEQEESILLSPERTFYVPDEVKKEGDKEANAEASEEAGKN